MNATHKKFIKNKLIPFILREQGRGFGMDDWITEAKPGTLVEFDEVVRAVPKCGTVACIGGSAEYLNDQARMKKPVGKRGKKRQAREILGLTHDQAEGLFMRWQDYHADNEYRWPIEYMKRYEEAETPLAKARVVVALLKEVVRTNGACLENKPYPTW